MATQGFISFVTDGVEKMAFVGRDSYPTGVGLLTLQWLREAARDLPRLRAQVAALRIVELNDVPTADDIRTVKATGVRMGHDIDWGELLHPTEGHADQMLAAGAAINATGFQYGGAAWGYVIDLDTSRFEVYRSMSPGDRHDLGRYSTAEDSDDIEVTLLRSWPLKSLPSDTRFLTNCGF